MSPPTLLQLSGPRTAHLEKNMMPSLSSLRDEIERDKETRRENLSRIMNKNLGTERRFQTQNS